MVGGAGYEPDHRGGRLGLPARLSVPVVADSRARLDYAQHVRPVFRPAPRRGGGSVFGRDDQAQYIAQSATDVGAPAVSVLSSLTSYQGRCLMILTISRPGCDMRRARRCGGRSGWPRSARSVPSRPPLADLQSGVDVRSVDSAGTRCAAGSGGALRPHNGGRPVSGEQLRQLAALAFMRARPEPSVSPRVTCRSTGPSTHLDICDRRSAYCVDGRRHGASSGALRS